MVCFEPTISSSALRTETAVKKGWLRVWLPKVNPAWLISLI
jgi:hypothetical protein